MVDRHPAFDYCWRVCQQCPMDDDPRMFPQPDVQEAGVEHTRRNPREPAAGDPGIHSISALPLTASSLPGYLSSGRGHSTILGSPITGQLHHPEVFVAVPSARDTDDPATADPARAAV